MVIRIKNWKLALLALIFFSLFISLGCWQVTRAHQKTNLIRAFNARTQQTPLSAAALHTRQDLRFYRAELTGHFDNEHTFLLDNKIHKGKIGYEVYTPFIVDGLPSLILVDRGFIPMQGTRDHIPIIKQLSGSMKVSGLLNLPPAYAALGEMRANGETSWPLVIEFIDLRLISQLLNQSFSPYVLSLSPSHPAAYPITWQAVTMTPERHMGYAIQWFALAIALLILFVALNLKRSR